MSNRDRLLALLLPVIWGINVVVVVIVAGVALATVGLRRAAGVAPSLRARAAPDPRVTNMLSRPFC